MYFSLQSKCSNKGTTDYTKLSIYYAPFTNLLYYQYSDTASNNQAVVFFFLFLNESIFFFLKIQFEVDKWYYIYIGVDYTYQQGYGVLYTPFLSTKAYNYYLIEAATGATTTTIFTAATILQLGDEMTFNFCGTMNNFKIIANYYSKTEYRYYLMNDDERNSFQFRFTLKLILSTA